MGEAAIDQTQLLDGADQLPPPQMLKRMSLREVRKELGRTQVQVAKEAGMSQGDLSRLERRTDHLLSTLERYAEALGGRLDVALVRGPRRYPLEF
ncbi:MAG TPA: helix-turn-helix transcriptional regulator [Polyangiaceae bacterium]|nr:helix-turn-helix transcriptional regulator [Polyangiaceae bacterium]